MAKEEEYFSFNDMITKAEISRSTLWRRIQDRVIGTKKLGSITLYSLADTIKSKQRKK